MPGDKPDPPSIHWLPRRGQGIRWDRSLPVGDATFRWHSRLDGSAILHGPAEILSVGDTVEMPAGHLHRPQDVQRAAYVVADVHIDESGQAWLRVVRST